MRRAVMVLWLGLFTVRVRVNLLSSPETSTMGVPSGVESDVDYNNKCHRMISASFVEITALSAIPSGGFAHIGSSTDRRSFECETVLRPSGSNNLLLKVLSALSTSMNTTNAASALAGRWAI